MTVLYSLQFLLSQSVLYCLLSIFHFSNFSLLVCFLKIMDVELSKHKDKGIVPPTDQWRRRIICMGVIALVLALAIFHTKHRVHLNVMLDKSVCVSNQDRVGFNYSTTFFLKYRGGIIGEAPIPAGNKCARGTQTMNDDTNRIGYSQVPMCIPDLLSSTLPLQTHMKISRK